MFLTIKNKLLIFKSFLALIILFSGTISASENKNLTSIGNADAKITVKVFSSLSCPHCADFHQKVFYKLKREFIDKNMVKFEHHSFPLDLRALNAEKILKCFDKKEKRLNFLSKVYEKQNDWSVGTDINSINEKLIKIAKNQNLDSGKIDVCLKDENLEDEILNERIAGDKKYSITSTPTILINEKKYEGKHNYEDFKKAIKKLL
tara:strand:- start:127 stop:741 length:615 start_codon:yes stop_codon:yes gene_type:complete